jgi:hypothetical protein
VIDSVALGQDFLRVLQFSTVSIIPPILCIHLYLCVAVTTGGEGQSLGTFKQQRHFGNPVILERKYFNFFIFERLRIIGIFSQIRDCEV